MPHLIREQRIRQRLTWFRKAQELGSVTEASVFFGISRRLSGGGDRPRLQPATQPALERQG